MAEGAEDFGLVERVQADAVGVPGQRRFRLRARTATDYAQLWVEREQTQALSLALEQLLAQIQMQRSEGKVASDPGASLDDFPPTPTVEFTVGRLGIGYDEDSDLIILQLSNIEQAAEGEEDAEPEPSSLSSQPGVPDVLTIRFNRPQAVALKEQCDQTLAAGRPRCPLCGAPMGPDGEHFCVRRNGHASGA